MKMKVEIEPTPQVRPRVSLESRCVYEPKHMKAYKSVISAQARIVMGAQPIMTGAVVMILKFYRKYKATSRRYGDFDNLAKAVCDALNGIVYADDSQIVSCRIEKYKDKNQRIEVECYEL